MSGHMLSIATNLVDLLKVSICFLRFQWQRLHTYSIVCQQTRQPSPQDLPLEVPAGSSYRFAQELPRQLPSTINLSIGCVRKESFAERAGTDPSRLHSHSMRITGYSSRKYVWGVGPSCCLFFPSERGLVHSSHGCSVVAHHMHLTGGHCRCGGPCSLARYGSGGRPSWPACLELPPPQDATTASAR